METKEFEILFKGHVVDNGTIDVKTLAPALLALGNVFETSNIILNGERYKTSVHVKATGEGSFHVVFVSNLSIISNVINHLFDIWFLEKMLL